MATDLGPQWPYPGARWWKFDFHTHTPASADYGKGPEQASLRQLTQEDWLLNFMRAQVDCVAVTDHNSGEWIDPLKDALRELERSGHPDYRPLTLFPGVEITANANIHILALFDANKGTTDIAGLLAVVGYKGSPGESKVAAKSSAVEVVEAISDADAIPILAHVDKPSGAWKLSGNTLAPLLDCDKLFSMEVVDTSAQKPELYRIRKLNWAEVLGSDSHHPSGNAGHRFPGSHFTWVKMAHPSLEGLRLALLDGERFSIRRSDGKQPFDPFAIPKHCVESIEIRDARYMGRSNSTRIELNPWLNALVGGRGTGKSTIIHALRLASNRERELTDLEKESISRITFERFSRVPVNREDQGGLMAKTMIIWTVMRDGIRYRVHWKYGDVAVVEEYVFDEGEWKRAEVQTTTPERFPLRLFSQGQIAELAGESQNALLGVIDVAADIAPLRKEFNEACNAFYATRARIRELDAKLSRRDEVSIEKSDVERKLAAFEGNHAALLTEYRRLDRQEREIERQFNEAIASADRIEVFAETLQLDDLAAGLFFPDSKEDRVALDVLKKLSNTMNTAKSNFLEEAERIRGSVDACKNALVGSARQKALDKAISQYNELIATLKAQGVSDPNAHGRLMQHKQRIEAEVQKLESEKQERERLVIQSKAELAAILQERRKIADARTKFLTNTLAHNNFVRINNQAYGNNLRVIERSLRQVLNISGDRFEADILSVDSSGKSFGVVADLLSDLPDSANDRITELEKRIKNLKHRLENACTADGDFRGHFNNNLKSQFGQNSEFLDKLLTWFPEDGLEIQYSRLGDGRDFQPIGHASAGQRSAAMLAFLLAYGDEPLVLDQPEDDLDNQLIYGLVVRQIRENKVRRQIIVVTHNPNVVVNGDAEMLHAFRFVNGQCSVALSGSLQDVEMRNKVCEIMEGGREAFSRRFKRLGSGLPNVR